jgi:hypothetical protein
MRLMKATAKIETASRKDKLRTAVLSISECCPTEECTPENCPLHNARELTRTQRLKWLNGLSEDDLIFLTAYHHVC